MSDTSKMAIAKLADWESYCDDSDAGPYITELARRLEAAEAKAATYWAECEAFRKSCDEYTGDVRVVYGQSGHIMSIVRARAATDAARGGAE